MVSTRGILLVASVLLLSVGMLAHAAGASTVPRPVHTVIVVMENHSYESIIGSTSAPYINGLANANALMTQSFAIGHPSEPNYLELWSGSNQGVTDDSCPHTFSTGSLGGQLLSAGMTVTGFNESMPSDGFTGCTGSAGGGNYAQKHNPLAMFPATADATHMKTYASWPSDFTTLPTVSLVVPNLCNDMHDCSIGTGDTWLKTHLDPYVQWARTHNSLAILTWDEDGGSNGNHVATVYAGQSVVPGQYAEHITHYSVLRTVEDAYGLSPLAGAGTVTPITDVWFGAPPPPSPSPSPTPTSTPTPTPSATPTPSPTPTPTPTPSATPTPSPTPTPTPSPSARPTPSPSATPTPTATPSTTPTPTPSTTPTPTPSTTPTPSPSPSPSSNPTPSPSPTPSPPPSPSPSPTASGLTVPGTPSAVVAVTGNHSAHVTWTGPTDVGGSPILKYWILVSDGSEYSVAGTQTNLTVKHLTNGNACNFMVRAENATGKGSYSPPSNTVVPSRPVHQTSAPLSATSGDSANGNDGAGGSGSAPAPQVSRSASVLVGSQVAGAAREPSPEVTGAGGALAYSGSELPLSAPAKSSNWAFAFVTGLFLLVVGCLFRFRRSRLGAHTSRKPS